MRARWLARLLLPRLMRWAEAREPNFKIVKAEGDASAVYLRRWWLVRRNDYFNVYLHNMVRDDDAVLHDHSYWSVSLVLSDGLVEVLCDRPDLVERFYGWNESTGNWDVPRPLDLPTRVREVRQGDLVPRSSRMAHQLKVTPGSDPWTIFVTGPRVKSWGFWCPQGWREWTKYTNVKQTAGRGTGTSGVGVGCGEE